MKTKSRTSNFAARHFSIVQILRQCGSTLCAIGFVLLHSAALAGASIHEPAPPAPTGPAESIQLVEPGEPAEMKAMEPDTGLTPIRTN